jgi:hypothetical protein
MLKDRTLSMLDVNELHAIRGTIAAISGDVSNDAVGANAPSVADIFAPETHGSALNTSTPIVVGARGAGKSFWSGVLGDEQTRAAAAKAYPRLGLERISVRFGFTGIGGSDGIPRDALNEYVPLAADLEMAKAFWWATIVRAATQDSGEEPLPTFPQLIEMISNWESREELLSRHDRRLRSAGRTLVVVYDALDMVATNWPRRQLLTEALLEVLWAMRAYHAIKLKLFLRPDQIDDDGLRFVELPKLRAGAVRLAWSRADLYGLFFTRLAPDQAFRNLLKRQNVNDADRDSILSRRWSLCYNEDDQMRVMQAMAGRFMGDGKFGYKKGNTYDWPVRHLADGLNEVTPRSFLGLMIAAAKYGSAPMDRVITPEGIRHGLRSASKTRVDELHNEFLWIKGVLAPLSGLLLPTEEKQVFKAWTRAQTVIEVLRDAKENNYLPPFPETSKEQASELCDAMIRIGVMSRRNDDRVDMPDIFRIAAKLLKKNAIAPR